MADMDRCSLLDRYRRGGSVVRYHTHRLLRRPNNAEHQWGCAVILLELLGTDALDVSPHRVAAGLVYMLMHDVPEYDTGDSPAWAKRAAPELRRALRAVEARVIARLDLPREPTDPGLAGPCRASDELEHLWTCLDERRLGNADVDSMFHRGARQLSDKLETWAESSVISGPWMDRARALLSGLVARYVELQGAEAFRRMWADVGEGRDYFAQAGDPAGVIHE